MDNLADLAAVVRIQKAAESNLEVGNHPVVDRSYLLWLEDRNLAASLRCILAAEKYLVVRTGSVGQDYMQFLAVPDNLIQESDWYIEQGNLAEKVAGDSLADLCTAVDLALLEAL